MPTPPSPVHAPIDHYENFPVASWLCPPRLRAPIAAIYHFARTADDIADEGDAPAARRLADLAAYRRELHASAAGVPPDGSRWPQVFGPLATQMRAFGLPLPPFDDLLSAFAQDVAMTRDGAAYPDLPALLDYCSRSANPVGRLLLHLYGVRDAPRRRPEQRRQICTALQLINFWQDVSVDDPARAAGTPAAEQTAARTDVASRRPAARTVAGPVAANRTAAKLLAHLAKPRARYHAKRLETRATARAGARGLGAARRGAGRPAHCGENRVDHALARPARPLRSATPRAGPARRAADPVAHAADVTIRA
jgi:squalene synthase HpnC